MAIVHANAQTFPQEVLQSNETVLVDFWAAWCGPCKMLAPILEELDGVAPCKIVKVDVDENRSLALQYAVASIPTLLVLRGSYLQGGRAEAGAGVSFLTKNVRGFCPAHFLTASPSHGPPAPHRSAWPPASAPAAYPVPSPDAPPLGR